MRRLLAALCSLSIIAAVTLSSVAPAAAFEGTVNDSGVNVRQRPSLSAPVVKKLFLGQEVDVVNSARGSSVGGDNLWYQLPSGGWVHNQLISEGGAAARGSLSGRWVDVNLSTQTARAMAGKSAVYTAEVTTGKPGWETPTGTFYVNRRPGTVNMRGADYYQPNVQYTQYFNNLGDALHANYWQPDYVFGNTPTSHGCVGMRTGDAAYFFSFGYVGMPVVIHY